MQKSSSLLLLICQFISIYTIHFISLLHFLILFSLYISMDMDVDVCDIQHASE